MFGVPAIYQQFLNEAINEMIHENDEHASIDVLEVAQLEDEDELSSEQIRDSYRN